MAGQTRFFCRCGRLLTVDASTQEVVCPTCRERNVVPQFGPQDRNAGASDARKVVAPSGAVHAAPVATSEPASRREAAGATAVLDLRAGHRLGRFELQQPIGQGGMGSVFRARDAVNGGEVALKVLHLALQGRPDFVSRFQREARAAAGLQHENIVRVLDSGIERGTPWISMELVEGEDLLAAAQRGVVTPENVVPFMLQATRGLAAAAALGITHRDIKPGNLLLRNDGVLKLADFGLAKAVDSSTALTVTGEVLGTPHYMAPEQGRGERVDHRADLYSLGATFYHVLAGAPPHEADTPVAVILKHLREEPLPLRNRCSRASPGLERVIHRLLQKSADSRYQSYAALVSDLERVAAGAEPRAGADPPMRRVQDGATTYVLPHDSTTELVLKPAGAPRRLLAFLLDLVAVEFALRLFVVAARVLVGSAAVGKPGASALERLKSLAQPTLHCDTTWQTAALASGCALAALLYFAISDAQGGRTLGKRWMSLRICRRDGRDLGVLRSFLRTLMLLPGIALLMPMLASATRELFECAGSPLPAGGGAMAAAGFAWLATLELIGRMSALGRPLQDAIVGAVAWKAQRHAWHPQFVPGSRRRVVPATALKLSIVPGLGLVYAGYVLLGLFFFALTAFAFVQSNDPRPGLALWAASAFAAHRLAARRRQRDDSASSAVLQGIDPAVVRRQES